MHLIFGEIDVQPLLDASAAFIESIGQVNSDLTRDGAIQRFEYTFELCWKTMKRLLRSKGSSVNHPKDVFREAAAEGLITEVNSWFEYLEARNRTAHIYKRAVAEEVFAILPRFKIDLEKFLVKLGEV